MRRGGGTRRAAERLLVALTLLVALVLPGFARAVCPMGVATRLAPASVCAMPARTAEREPCGMACCHPAKPVPSGVRLTPALAPACPCATVADPAAIPTRLAETPAAPAILPAAATPLPALPAEALTPFVETSAPPESRPPRPDRPRGPPSWSR